MSKQEEFVHTKGSRKEGYINTVNGEQIGPVYKTKKEAVLAGREEAKARQVEHVIHGQDGKIRERNSYGNDSPRSKG